VSPYQPGQRRRTVDLRTSETRVTAWRTFLASLGDLSGPPAPALMVVDRTWRHAWVVGCPHPAAVHDLPAIIATASAITVGVERVGSIAFATALWLTLPPTLDDFTANAPSEGAALQIVDVQPGVEPLRWLIPYQPDGWIGRPVATQALRDAMGSEIVAALRVACETAGQPDQLESVMRWQREHGYDPRELSV
jgi:hypothetical protein